jgi:hypothetical protein
MIECRQCQRPWPRAVGAPADRICTDCRHPGAQPLLAGVPPNSGLTSCRRCGLTVTEPQWLHDSEHCHPIAPPTVDYRAAKAELEAANIESSLARAAEEAAMAERLANHFDGCRCARCLPVLDGEVISEQEVSL